MRRIGVSALAVILALGAWSGVQGAEKKGRKVDQIWASPEFKPAQLTSIAMFPAASYDRNLQVEKLVAALWSNSLKDAGYRWVSTASTQTMIQSTEGDSVYRAIHGGLLREPRIDSLAAPGLCAKLRTSAILTMRVERWEQQQIEWNQAGRPSTTIQLRAALVDSTGRLLWTAAGSETGDGPYHDPSTNPIGVTSGGLGNTPITGQGGPPAYNDVAARLFTRWATQFPARTTAPTP